MTTAAARRTALDAGLGLLATLAALTLFYFRLGYDAGTSDQDEVVPFLLHRLDPTLFRTDWFVQGQAAGFGIRTYFVGLLEAAARLSSVEGALLGGYLGAWLLIGTALVRLGALLTGSRLAGLLLPTLVLALTPQWTLGGNELVHTLLTPSMPAWGLALWGMVAFVRRRWVVAGVLLGLALWMQALVGLLMAALLGAALLLEGGWAPGVHLRTTLRFGAAFVLTSLPALAPLLLQQIAPATPTDPDAVFYVVASLRNPHHYLPFSFPLRSYLRFGLLVLLGLAALWAARQAPGRPLTLRLLALVAGALMLGLVFTEGVPFLPIAKLQLFKLTVPAKVLLLAWVAGWAVAWLPPAWAPRLTAYFAGAMAVLGGVLLAASLAGAAWLRAPRHDQARALRPEGQVAAWARAHTPATAVFAVPPSWSFFRSAARRAVVVNFKAFPYEDARMLAWLRRMQALAPMPLPARAGPGLQARLDSAYAARVATTWPRLRGDYGAAYAVVPDTVVLAGAALRFEAGAWRLYQLPSP